MNQNEQQTSTAKLDDLAVREAEQAEIKGGPKKIFIGGLSATEASTSLPDLEAPNAAAVKGGTKLPPPTIPISAPPPSRK